MDLYVLRFGVVRSECFSGGGQWYRGIERGLDDHGRNLLEIEQGINRQQKSKRLQS